MLGRLQLWRRGRQQGQVDAIRHLEVVTDVPASLVDDQHDLLVWSRTRGLGKLLKGKLVDPGVDRWQDEPEALASFGPDEAVEVEPLVARMDCGDGALTFGSPDPTQDGLEAKPMLVLAPDLDLGIGIAIPDARDNACQALF